MRSGARLALCFGSGLLGILRGATAWAATGSSLGGDELAVESVEAGSLGERSGLRAGDLLSSWTRASAPPENPFPDAGLLASPFDLRLALIEEAPRGALCLCGRRGDVRHCWTLIAGASLERAGIRTRPALLPGPETTDPLWLGAARALGAAEARAYGEGDAAFAEVLPRLAWAGRAREAADLLVAWGASFDERGSWAEGAARFERALALTSEAPAGALLRARALHGLGEIYRHSDDYERARPTHARALALRSAWAPRSLVSSDSYFAVARSESESGHLSVDEVEPLLQRALDLQDSVDRGSLAQARIVSYEGTVLWNGGRLFAGERLLREGYRMAALWEPRGALVARGLLQLGTVLDRRGEMVEAERLLSESLALWEELPATVQNRRNLATVWWTLAYLKANQGDLESAEEDARRALEIQTAIQHRSSGVAEALDVLGYVQTLLSRFADARRSLREAVALHEELAPGSQYLGSSLVLLGGLELAARESLEEAERVLRRAAAVFERASPGSFAQAEGLGLLGRAVAARGRLAEGLKLVRRSLELRRALGPGGPAEAESLHWLGLLEERAGRLQAAAESQCGAVEILDRLGDRLAGAQRARASWSGAYRDDYFDCLRLRWTQGRNAEAFRILEAGHARALLDLFGMRDLDLAELPPDVRRERERQLEEYIRLSDRLSAAASSGDPAARDGALRELLENERRHDALSLRIRSLAPRVAELQAPRPVDLDGARRALDPGTVLLAYALGAERSFLFVVRPRNAPGPALRVIPLAFGAAALGPEVEAFRLALSDPASSIASLRRRGARLYARLVAPAEPWLGSAQRLLVAPDGILHRLPFAPLVRRDGRYLVQWKPLHKVVSMTVYAELRRRRPVAGLRATVKLGAAGDPGPSPPGSPAPSREARVAVRSADPKGSFAPLAGAREELAAIAGIFAPHSRLLAGVDATVSGVKALAREVDVLHLATHAYVDEVVPLNSALVLSPSSAPAGGGADDDGRLEAWEIVEKMRFEASLVTLSACETGLGRQSGGEGIIGLTRAFQFAGARTVLASLWAVRDGSTARFMPEFYRRLREGRSKDEALRTAQLWALGDPELAHPGFWAAFELNGEFR